MLLDEIHIFWGGRPSQTLAAGQGPPVQRGQSGRKHKMGHQHDNGLRDVNRRAKNVTSHYWPISNYELAM